MGSASATIERILNPELTPPEAPQARSMTLPFNATSPGQIDIEGLKGINIGTASDITPLNPGSFDPINPIDYQQMLGNPNNRWDMATAQDLEVMAELYEGQSEAIRRGCAAAVTIAEKHTEGVVEISGARVKISDAHYTRNKALADELQHQLGLAPKYQKLGLQLGHAAGQSQHQMRLNMAHYVAVLQQALPQ